jgi:hypothetical protein
MWTASVTLIIPLGHLPNANQISNARINSNRGNNVFLMEPK